MGKPEADPRMSLTTPTMTWEMESACHSLSRHVLRRHLDQKFGPDKWGIAGAGFKGEVDANGVTRLSNDDLAANSVECGLVEMRRQLADYDRRRAGDLFGHDHRPINSQEK